ncbi:related to Mig1 protein, induced during biotrophic phase [Ustilago sp. UG-2017b]|nr:related to Mig1 protein, induced during biotrophic phase [Ustilago sp. UG-2017b]
MTRASTSAANFGLLLVALVLMLHSVVSELTPNIFTLDDKAYKSHCGEDSDPKHPCFTHWAGDLQNAQRCYSTGKRVDKEIITNDVMKDKLLHLQPPSQDFKIIYPNLGGVSLTYKNFDEKTGCKDIGIERGDNNVWRIWVSDEDGNGRDIDTKHHGETSKRLCSKWIHIHVKRDG